MSAQFPPLALIALLCLSTPASTALCPSFTLTASAPGQAFDGQKIIQSGRSIYIGAQVGTPVSPDSYAIFFRNDTSHLYGTGFNVSYDYDGFKLFETPPFLLYALVDTGFPIFTNDTSQGVKGSGEEWTAERFFIDGEGGVGFAPAGEGFAGSGNDSAPGGWWVCGGEISLGVSSSGGDGCVKTVFKMSDVNITEAGFC